MARSSMDAARSWRGSCGLAGLLLGVCLAAALPAAVTDFFIVMPKSAGEKPMARVMDDKEGIQTYDLGEPFDEVDSQGGHWKDSVGWWFWHRRHALSYVVIKRSRRDGDPNAPQWCTFKRVGEDGKESWRKGPVRLRPLGVSAGCERVVCGREQGEAGLETLDAIQVLDAKGAALWSVAKPGLGYHLAISAGGLQLAYIDGLELVIRDLGAGTETRDALAEVRNVTGTHDVRWISGVKDDGTVVFRVRMIQYGVGPSELLESHFKHGDKG